MEKEDLEKTVDEIQEESGEIKPIPQGEGMIAYRKYLWALWFIQKRIEELENYRAEVVRDIDAEIQKKKDSIERIRSAIEMALEVDPIAEKTKAGGRKLVLPDIATVSISKVSDKVVIEDPNTLLENLGEEFKKVRISLDTTKAKQYLEKQDELPEGARKEKSRTLNIRFKK